MHLECEAMRAHALPLHRALLSCDDCTRARTRLRPRRGRFSRMARVGYRHSGRKQADLVVDRTSMGEILLSPLANSPLTRPSVTTSFMFLVPSRSLSRP